MNIKEKIKLFLNHQHGLTSDQKFYP